MKKISFLTKIVFHIYNILLILMYIYPGSVMGWIVYRDIQKQPQLSNDFTLFSSNHVYAFLVLSFFRVVPLFYTAKKFSVSRFIRKHFRSFFSFFSILYI